MNIETSPRPHRPNREAGASYRYARNSDSRLKKTGGGLDDRLSKTDVKPKANLVVIDFSEASVGHKPKGMTDKHYRSVRPEALLKVAHMVQFSENDKHRLSTELGIKLQKRKLKAVVDNM